MHRDETVKLRAPDARLKSYSGYRMKRALTVIQADVNAALKPHGLRMVTFSILVVVCDAPGIRQSDLAKTLLIERPNLVVLVDDLEQRGLLRRERVPHDRRAYAIAPTDLGLSLCTKAIATVDAHEAHVTQHIAQTDLPEFLENLSKVERAGVKGA